jgi:PE family
MTAEFHPVAVAVLAVCNQPAPKHFHAGPCLGLALSSCALIQRRKPMSFVSVVPEILATAAENLQSVGLRLQAQNSAAVAPTTGLMPPASDEVSALTAMQFIAHAHAYQAVSAQAAAIHQMFVTMLAAGADSYTTAEAANAAAVG